MLASTYPWIFVIAISLASFGCNQTVSQRSLPKLSLPKQVSSKDGTPRQSITTQNGYPVIYDAWNARYKYDPLTREMNAVSNNKPVGLSWSRDQQGRLDFMYYYSGGLGRDENLLIDHRESLDKKRDMQWEQERESWFLQVEDRLARLDSNQTEVVNEEVVDQEEEVMDQNFQTFTPLISIPSNTDNSKGELSQENQSGFLPLPSMDNQDSGNSETQEMSPFAPLPSIE